MRYRDKREADQAIRHIGNSSRMDVVPVRSYECPTCNGWHVSPS